MSVLRKTDLKTDLSFVRDRPISKTDLKTVVRAGVEKPISVSKDALKTETTIFGPRSVLPLFASVSKTIWVPDRPKLEVVRFVFSNTESRWIKLDNQQSRANG